MAQTTLRVAGRPATADLLNGELPAPLLRCMREGEKFDVDVTNSLAEDTSIHWHGLLVPPAMDGVRGISFPGIKPGETSRIVFPFRQSGTYWSHSHSSGQELPGLFAPIVIEPAARLDYELLWTQLWVVRTIIRLICVRDRLPKLPK